MEKFGIFELLDALSALTDGGRETGSAAPRDGTKPAERTNGAAPPEGSAAPSPSVSASGSAAPSSSVSASGSAAPQPGRDALADFLARHDAIAKKTRKK